MTGRCLDRGGPELMEALFRRSNSSSASLVNQILDKLSQNVGGRLLIFDFLDGRRPTQSSGPCLLRCESPPETGIGIGYSECTCFAVQNT